MRRLRRLVKGTRGSAVVEFALILPILLTLVFGIIEMGSAWYSKQMLVNASREGARFGAMFNGADNAQVIAFVNQILTQAGFPGAVEVTSSGAGGSTGALVQVMITGQHELPVLGGLVPGLPSSINLQASTVMRHE